MINEKISGKQAVNIIILFMLGSSLVTGGSINAGRDSWLSLIIGLIMSIPIVLMYARINKLQPDKDLFELSYMVLGKVGGAIVTCLFSVYAIHLGILVIRSFTEYIHVVSFPETPQSYVAICICLIMFFTVKQGIEILGRGNVLLMPIIISAIMLLVLLSIKNMDINNLKPMLYNNFKPIMAEAYSMVIFPFADIVIFISVFSIVETKKNPSKLYLSGIMIFASILIVVILWDILVLGFPLVNSLYFPTFSNAGIIEVGNFFSRVEIIISGSFIVFGLVKATVCLYVGCKGIAKLFNIGNHKKMAAPLSLIMMISSVYIFKNTMQLFRFVDIYILYAPFFQIVIPLIVLIFMEIKIKKLEIGEKKNEA